jgi:hypothetical protein
MKTITIHAIRKGSSEQMSRTIDITNLTVEELNSIKDEFFEEVIYPRWYYQVECFDELTEEDEQLLADCELSVDF